MAPIETSKTEASVDDYLFFTNDSTDNVSWGKSTSRTRLRNTLSSNSCYLNVFIQSLWRLGRFRKKFQDMFKCHDHVGKPCVVCALYCVFTAMSQAQGEAVDPATLRIALREANHSLPEMNDACEILEILFGHMEASFTSSGGGDDNLEMGNRVCGSDRCMPHLLFKINISESVNCDECKLESRFPTYSSYVHRVAANKLREMKITCADSAFGELLKNIWVKDQEICHCGKLKNIRREMSCPPHVFTASLNWNNNYTSPDEISATLAAISFEVDIGVLHADVHHGSKHVLVSMVCYSSSHYVCFIYSCDPEEWVLHDDETVEVIGGWNDVVSRCCDGKWQPVLLFYEGED